MDHVATILIIEDGKYIRTALTDRGEVDYHEIVSAGDLQTVWRMLRMHPPALVVLDGHLIGAYAGDVLRYVRMSIPDVPVILMSDGDPLRDGLFPPETGGVTVIQDGSVDTLQRRVAAEVARFTWSDGVQPGKHFAQPRTART